MSMRRRRRSLQCCVWSVVALFSTAATFKGNLFVIFGEPDISILPDGTGLPAGSGTPQQGAAVFAAKCAVCHGENGKGGSAAALVGGEPLTSGIETAKTVANFWPYATTIFDFTRRAMPWPRPRTLTNDEVYALTAFILAQNKIIGGNDVMNAQTLPKIRMPNRDGFIPRFPERIP